MYYLAFAHKPSISIFFDTYRRPFDYFILVTILCNCLALAFNHPYPGEDSNAVNQVLEKVELAFVIIFTTESVLKIIAYGFVLHPGAYLRTFWNVLDFSIVLIGLSSKALEETGGDVKALRAFRVLRPLRLLSGLPSLQVVLNSIITAMVPLLHIALLVIFVIIVYAIIGLELFQSKLHYTCYKNTTLKPEMMPNPRPCTNETSQMGFKCDELGPNYVCLDLESDRYSGPQDGIVSFDNFLLSMLTVFVCVTMEGWTSTGYYVRSVSIILVEFNQQPLCFIKMKCHISFQGFRCGRFLVAVDLLCHFDLTWIIFCHELGIGGVKRVISACESYLKHSSVFHSKQHSEFSKEKEKIDRTLLFRKERQAKREQQDYLGYKEWIEVAEELSDSEGEEKSSEDMESGTGIELAQTEPEVNVEEVVKSHCQITLKRFRKFRKRIRRAVIAFTNSRQCFALIIILVFLNTVILTTEHYNQPRWLDEFQDFANKVFVALFTLEMLVKIAASGFADYFSKLFNRFDFFVVIFSILELLLVQFNVLDPMGVSVLRCARLLRIFKVTHYWESLRSLVGKLLKSVRSVASLLLLLFIFILICSLLGMQLFGGRFNFVNKEKPRANFDGILQAMLTVFQWLPEQMFVDILLNVFLAIAVDNLNDDDDDDDDGPSAEGEKQDEKSMEVVKENQSKEIIPEPEKTEVLEAKSKTVENQLDTQNQTYEEMFPEVDIYGDDGEEGGGEENRDDQKDFSAQDSRTMPPHSAFFIFSDTNKFRIFCHNVVCLSHFGNIVLVCILVSSILLAAEDPLHASSHRNNILNMFDYFFTSVFTVEITLKMISYGFILHEGAFCRSAFNLLDLIVVCVALVSFVLRLHDSTVLLLLTSSFVSFNRGSFIEYEDMNLDKPVITKREWNNSDYNFDNVPNALLTLFAVSTFEGWPTLLSTSIDSNEEDHGPITNYRPVVAVFYITYIIVIPFFMINIFIGFVIVTFQREGESEYKNCELDKNQVEKLIMDYIIRSFLAIQERRKCIEYALKSRPRRRYIPKGHFQYKIWSVVVSKKFEIFIFICIFINTVALTLKHYFSDIWNVVDFVLVLGSYIDIIVTQSEFKSTKFSVNFFRLFRVMRLVKLLSKEESIRQLLWTFIKSVQALPYVALLIAMIFFIYAVIGMQLFGQISIAEDPLNQTELPPLHRNNNFQNFFHALLVLFRCSTGESWQDIMMACVSGQPCATDSDEKVPNSCGSKLAYIYFISFYAISAFLVINLFVAVIMDNFDYLTRDWSILGPHHLDEFVTKWADYDPEAKGRVRHLDVVTMLGKISPPLGFGSMCPHTRACHKLVRMNMPLNSDGTVFFNATLFALVRRNLKIKIPGDDREKEKSLDQLNEELRAVIKRVWKRTSPKLLDQIIPPKGSDVVTVGKFYATFLIQNWFREWQKKKMIQKDTRYIPQIMAGDRAMPHQPTIVGFPRRCSSDLTGDEIQRRRGADKRDTAGGIFGRTLVEWTRRRSSKRTSDKRDLIGGGFRVPIMDEHGVAYNLVNGGTGGADKFAMGGGLNAQPGQTAHPAVVALLEKEKKEAETARPESDKGIPNKNISTQHLSLAPTEPLHFRILNNLKLPNPQYTPQPISQTRLEVLRSMSQIPRNSAELTRAVKFNRASYTKHRTAVYDLFPRSSYVSTHLNVSTPPTTVSGLMPLFSPHELKRMLLVGRHPIRSNQLFVPQANQPSDTGSQSSAFLEPARNVLGFLRKGSFLSSQGDKRRESPGTLEEDLDIARQMLAAARQESLLANRNHVGVFMYLV
ncbi:voltage-dependent calcium channel L type alpha-1D [Paragonimus westermani]|uniref:Voltage-dependent L-type calcium channel subunit alpha n=1 Tax=Paragonimus westermani TaxID=34504 RepID=A0A5J4NQY0_9TREM|nr:voltage-dependent calcium channel L type alpha-1D [Paragonimus westermani]